MKIEIYSDLVCPWCYVGEKRFARALAGLQPAENVEVSFRPFQLDPNAAATPAPVTEYLQRRFGALAAAATQRVTEAAAEEGITMNWDRAVAVNTRTAHRLLRLAHVEYGSKVQLDLAERLFAAHFTDGANLADHDELSDRAVAAGMDEQRVREYLASGEGGDEVDGELEHARAIGVTAVPTFVFDGRYAVSGAQPAETFTDVLVEVRRRAAAT